MDALKYGGIAGRSGG